MGVRSRGWCGVLAVLAAVALGLASPGMSLAAAQAQAQATQAKAQSKSQAKVKNKAKAKAKTTRAGKVRAKAARSLPVLRVGTTGDYPPFSWRDPATGQFLGSDIDQAQALAKSLGRRVQFVPTTWRTLQADLVGGRFHIAMGGVSITPERSARGYFSRPYLQDGKTPIARCSDADRFQTIEQINRPAVRVIVNPGGTNDRFARAHLYMASLTVFNDNTAIFDEILEERADVMVTDAIEARLQQRLRPGLCAVHPAEPFDRSSKAYWMARDAKLRKQVDAWLTRSLSTGSATRTLDKWLDHSWPRHVVADPVAVTHLGNLVDERLSLMPDVARYKWNTGAAIEDPQREQQLLASVRQQAIERGLPPQRVVDFFAAQIEASKVVQRELFERWRKAEQGPFEAIVDLATQIRPRLDALNPQLLDALAAVPVAVPRDQAPVLLFLATSPAAVAVALSPLLEPPGTATLH